jgi:MoaA/NifB/PqqE/SkfB family radical SAM enzyme
MSDERKMDGTKLMYHMPRVIKHFDQGERVAPIHIDMGISKFCDISCVYCFGKFQYPKKEYIKREALLGALRDAGEIGVKSIAFIGDGEPLMNPHVYEGLKTGKASGLSMALSTDGVTLDSDEKAKTVLDCCEWMRFTISAGDRKGYRKNHRFDYFEKVKENIKRIMALKNETGSKCDIGLQAVFVPGLMNEDMIKEARLAVELGVDYFVIKQCSLPEGNKAVGSVTFDVEEYDNPFTIVVLEEAESLSTEKTKIIPKWKTMERKGAREYRHCPAVPLISEISGDGSWFPCGYFFGNKPEYDNYKFGNIHEKSLKEIYESERYWNIISYFREKFDSQNECKGSCRLDSCNKFVSEYLDKPRGINFI